MIGSIAHCSQQANERRAAMRAANPAFIPRNHLVEEAISAAVNEWVFPALRESADGALHALRGSTGLRPLRRSAAARSSRAPNVLRHLTKEGQARRRHLVERRYCGPIANLIEAGFLKYAKRHDADAIESALAALREDWKGRPRKIR
jgi:hypothetical protein